MIGYIVIGLLLALPLYVVVLPLAWVAGTIHGLIRRRLKARKAEAAITINLENTP